ncbi:unnamed protein product, partial [Mesorhabditis spiculigera]
MMREWSSTGGVWCDRIPEEDSDYETDSRRSGSVLTSSAFSRCSTSSPNVQMSGLSFQLQSGLNRKTVTVDGQEISLRDLRNEAFRFLVESNPNDSPGESLQEQLLLYKHDLRSINILQLVTSSADVQEGTLVEVVLGSCPHYERLVVHPHTLYVHSYKSPTFCDFCGELLFGLVKQGLKCQGCGLNYHKRCASKIPNNCNGSRQRRPSAIPLSPSNSHGFRPSIGGGSSTAEAPDSTRPPALTPDIYVTTDHDCGDAIGGNFLQMPRKDRSCSWSGRPLWMEVAEATRVKVPHTFQVHSYKKPTVCQFCKKLLRGLIRQGIQCRDCKYNCHKKCSEQVPRDCPGPTSNAQPFFLGASDDHSNFGGSMESLRMNSVPFDTDQSSGTHDESADEGSGLLRHKKATNTPSAPLAGQNETGTTITFNNGAASPEADDAALNESQNIPLMRIVMSKKQTKRKSNKVIKEGWMVHYTNQHSMRKKHYWRLDTKSIMMYQDETSTRYYKEIPLNEVLELKEVEHEGLSRKGTHFCEIRTQGCTYFVGMLIWGCMTK